MRNTSTSGSRALRLACCLVAAAASIPRAIAQNPYAMQAYAQSAGEANNQFCGSGTSGTVSYGQLATSIPTPSEVRYAYWQSGATPASVVATIAQVGPLPPHGAIDYIPQPPGYLNRSDVVPASAAETAPPGPQLTASGALAQIQGTAYQVDRTFIYARSLAPRPLSNAVGTVHY